VKKFNTEIRIDIGGNKIVGLDSTHNFFYDSKTRTCIFGMYIAYGDKTEVGVDFDDYFLLNAQYFLTNDGMHFDFDNNMLYFTGKNIYDNTTPIPDPVVPKKSFPTWAIILLVVVGVLGVGVLIWYLKRNKDLRSNLSNYKNLH
jgi:hypothetical protein